MSQGLFSLFVVVFGTFWNILGGAKIAAVVLHTMNIEGQIHQKNLGNARILEAPGIATPPLVNNLKLSYLVRREPEKVRRHLANSTIPLVSPNLVPISKNKYYPFPPHWF